MSMADQFRGLPMGDLIGGPLMAACDAQVRLANATASFIQQVGFMPRQIGTEISDQNPPDKIRQVSFKFNRPSTAPAADGAAGTIPTELVELEVPLLAIVKIPALSISTVDITFDMEVKNSERSTESEDKKGSFSADASVGWGPFSLKVHVEGSVSTHKENTRQSDQSAKYHVEVRAEDKGMPEGLARVLDMMNSAIAPRRITATPADDKPQNALLTGSSDTPARTPVNSFSAQDSPTSTGGPSAAAPDATPTQILHLQAGQTYRVEAETV